MNSGIEVYTAADLAEMELRQPEFFVDGLLPEGLSFVAGPPKFGKTYLNLQLGVSIASGEPFLGRRTRQCTVLYLYLEGDAAQVQRRLHDIYGDRAYPRELVFVHSMHPLASGGLEALAHLIMKYQPGLIIVDTWQLVRGEDMLGTGRGQTAYMREYTELTKLRAELIGKMGVSVLLTHHTAKENGREKNADDLTRLNGSTALSGCADAVLLLSGTRGNKSITLRAHGRTFEDVEIPLTRTSPMGWKAVEKEPAKQTPVQQFLLQVLEEHPEGITSTDAYRILSPGPGGVPEDTLRRQLNRWAWCGKIIKDGKVFRIKK